MTTPIFYRSSDASAPTLSGSTGALVGVLDACLVNGYGSKSAAGWAISFTTTNQRTYRAPGGGPRQYAYVIDTSTTAGSIQGQTVATAIGVGTGAYPPSAATTITKSTTADATARPWLLVADDRTFYLWIDPGVTLATSLTTFIGRLCVFGEFYSITASDNYRSICAGEHSSGSFLAAVQGGRNGVSRAAFQVGPPIAVNIGAGDACPIISSGTTSAWPMPSWPFPNPADNGVHLSRISIGSSTVGLRGYFRGVWCCQHTGFSTALNDPTDCDGDAGGVYAGRNFVFVNTRSSGGSNGWLAVESTAWDYNA